MMAGEGDVTTDIKVNKMVYNHLRSLYQPAKTKGKQALQTETTAKNSAFSARE